MKAEPLNIRDKRFLINRLIEQAPVSTLVREFLREYPMVPAIVKK